MQINENTLLDTLTLLVNINTISTRKLCSDLLKYFNNQLSSKIITDNIIEDYKKILVDIIVEIIDLKITKDNNNTDLKTIYNKVKLNPIFKQMPNYLDPLTSILTIEDNVSSEYLDSISNKLSNIVIWFKCNEKLKYMYGHLNNMNINQLDESVEKSFNSIINTSQDIEKIIRQRKNIQDLAIERIHSSSFDEISNAYKLYKERNITHIIKLGLQGMNRALGKKGGIPLGRSVVFGALTHNYKSTMLLSVARWCKEYNYFPIKDGKKPLILFISLENEGHENMMLWWKTAYETLIKDKLEKEPETEEEVIKQIYDYFYQADIEIVIERYLPSEFGYNELVELINNYEDSGFYIPVCIIDYLSQMKLIDTNGYNSYSNQGNYLLIKNLYNKVCNFCGSKGITLFTGNQLNTQAAYLLNSGVNPVKKFNQSHFSGASDVAREVDIIYFLHIEKNQNGDPYLTIQLNKDRYETTTKEQYKFIAYKFTEHGIIDDINTSFQGVKDIYKIDNENNINNNIIDDPDNLTF